MGWPSDQDAPKFDGSEPHILNNPPPDVDWNNLADNFVKLPNTILLKRDTTTSNHPCSEDLEVGELVFNALTGNLYSKTLGGNVVMYEPSRLCSQSSQPPVGAYKFNLSIPDTCGNICTNSGFGITLTSAKNNAIRFDPVDISEGLPASYNLYLNKDGIRTQIGRISTISDYKSTMAFQFVYYINDNTYYTLDGKFTNGTYDNNTFGQLIVELL